MHAYSVKDCSRETYIYRLTIFAVAVVAVANQAAGLIGITISIGVVTVFTTAFFVFDRWIWRWRWISQMVGIPDLAGNWTLSGHSIAADGQSRNWTAKARVEQTWSKIAISIENETSRSRSGMAAIERDPGHGFRVIYGYTNEPKRADTELRSHRGTCEVVFTDDLRCGQGTYFNDHQRRTVGEMQWSRDLPKGVEE